MSEKYTGWYFDWTEDWSQLRPGFNWRTFRLVDIEFEDDRMMGALEATFVVFGIGGSVRWNYRLTEQAADIISTAERAKTESEN